ncbi:hypothetical protein C1I98_25995 [Spongiactinospora gelatinilytica]|uniref:Uncharacterized protein n=1 Tax=Spongiactinospora gelatinilytica TaxID=2666298 RepID=A0A2W2GSE0_9ACTN|nr:hypothetical protein C1I98_25995 [Spongiactinospora gelatinilytica]
MIADEAAGEFGQDALEGEFWGCGYEARRGHGAVRPEVRHSAGGELHCLFIATEQGRGVAFGATAFCEELGVGREDLIRNDAFQQATRIELILSVHDTPWSEGSGSRTACDGR